MASSDLTTSNDSFLERSQTLKRSFEEMFDGISGLFDDYHKHLAKVICGNCGENVVLGFASMASDSDSGCSDDGQSSTTGSKSHCDDEDLSDTASVHDEEGADDLNKNDNIQGVTISKSNGKFATYISISLFYFFLFSI